MQPPSARDLDLTTFTFEERLDRTLPGGDRERDRPALSGRRCLGVEEEAALTELDARLSVETERDDRMTRLGDPAHRDRGDVLPGCVVERTPEVDRGGVALAISLQIEAHPLAEDLLAEV